MESVLRTIVLCVALGISDAGAEAICEVVRDAKIVAQDDENTYLGKVASRYGSDSIFNKYGDFGSRYSSKSIWNKYGDFGNQYGQYSPFNKHASQPPMLIKEGRIIGYLSANKSIESSISPNLLKALCEEEL